MTKLSTKLELSVIPYSAGAWVGVVFVGWFIPASIAGALGCAIGITGTMLILKLLGQAEWV